MRAEVAAILRVAARLLTCLTIGAACSSPAFALAAVHRFGLVVGANQPAGEDRLTRLRFADDDAVRNAQVLRLAGVEVEVLAYSAPDDDSRVYYPRWSRDLREAPRRDVVIDRITRLLGRAAAVAAPDTAEIYLWIAAHGGLIEGGEPAIFLHDRPLTRTDLYETLIKRIPPRTRVHIFIDACAGRPFLSSRSKRAKDAASADTPPEDLARLYVDSQSLLKYPEVGALVASNPDGETNEWPRVRGGVFSYVLRSGLLGAADGDNDGAVSYEELQAFVEAATQNVTLPAARVIPYAYYPAGDPGHTIVDWKERTSTTTRFVFESGSAAQHLRFLDEKATPILELHKEPGAMLTIHLPQDDRPRIVERREAGKVLAAALAPQEGGAQVLERAGLAFQARGEARVSSDARDEALRSGLFHARFGPGYLNGFRTGARRLHAHEPGSTVRSVRELDRTPRGSGSITRLIGMGALGVGALGAAGGLGFYLAGESAYDDYRAATDPGARAQARTRTETFDRLATASLWTAGAFGVGGLAVLLVDWLMTKPPARGPDAEIAFGPQGASLRLRF